jgi:hypothetical protein
LDGLTTWDPSSDSALFVARIKQEIERLTREQQEATDAATFVGMTQAQKEEYYARRRRLTMLIEHLAIFEETQ